MPNPRLDSNRNESNSTKSRTITSCSREDTRVFLAPCLSAHSSRPTLITYVSVSSTNCVARKRKILCHSWKLPEFGFALLSAVSPSSFPNFMFTMCFCHVSLFRSHSLSLVRYCFLSGPPRPVHLERVSHALKYFFSKFIF